MLQHNALISLLNSEVKPALGCTEPAAVALAVAKATKLLGGGIENIIVTVSGNLLKNAMGVTIPNTREVGLEMAAALGMIKGNPDKELEVFDGVADGDVEKARRFTALGNVRVHLAKENGFYIRARVEGEGGWAEVYVVGSHTNIVKMIVNGIKIFSKDSQGGLDDHETVDVTQYTLADFVEAIETIPVDQISFLQDGIDMNLFIASRGLELNAGLGVGAALKSLLDKGVVCADVVYKARMIVAAACDARMAGLKIPVMSTSGSGNHGIEAILPIAVVAEEMDAPKEKVLRALAFSHLVTAFVKQHTGKLSPICGCSVAAGAGAAAAIVWLMGGKIEQIEGAIKNIIGNLAGMICDGAKGGCALKLSTSAGEAIIAAQLALQGVIVSPKDGIISNTVEETVKNLGRVSSSGMTCTDEAILQIMINKERNHFNT